MVFIVIGCGRVGAELAYRLYKRGHKVSVIDQSDAAFLNLPPDFRGKTVEGEAMNRDVLRRAGIEHADGVAVVTTSDSLNLVIAHVARDVFHIQNVVVRNYDPKTRALYEIFNLQVVSSSSWGAQRLEEMLYHAELHTVFSAGNGEVEIYEFSILEEWAGHSLEELLPDHQCVPVSLTRAGKALLPACDTQLESGDIILVSATFDGIRALREKLIALKEG